MFQTYGLCLHKRRTKETSPNNLQSKQKLFPKLMQYRIRTHSFRSFRICQVNITKYTFYQQQMENIVSMSSLRLFCQKEIKTHYTKPSEWMKTLQLTESERWKRIEFNIYILDCGGRGEFCFKKIFGRFCSVTLKTLQNHHQNKLNSNSTQWHVFFNQ